MSEYKLVPATAIEKTDYQYFLRNRDNGNVYKMPVSCDVFEPKTMACYNFCATKNLYFKSKLDAKRFIKSYELNNYEVVESYYDRGRLILITV